MVLGGFGDFWSFLVVLGGSWGFLVNFLRLLVFFGVFFRFFGGSS